MKRWIPLIGVVSLGAVSGAAFSQDFSWTGWLGPERNGWVEKFRPPAEWPASLKKSWQVKVGTGYGTPLVSDGRIFQHARQGDKEVVWCLDLATGSTKWRKAFTVPFKIGGGGEFHGKGPKSTPVYADGRLFTLSITGVLSAWDVETGDLLWRHDDRKRFKPNQPYWGVSTSPLVDEDRLVVHLGNDEKGMLVAFDVKTGKEVWTQGNHGTAYASPLVVEIAGVRQIVDWNHETLAGVESKTGQLLWEFPLPHRGTNQNMPTPTFHRGRIIVGGENRGIRAVEPKRDANGKWSAKEIWHQEEVALDMSTAVINGDFLYGFSHYKMGRLFCLDPNTGKVLWQSKGRTGDNVAFLSSPGHVFALIDDGTFQVLAANNEAHRVVASYEVASSPTWAPPVLLEKGLLIKDKESLTYWSW